MKCFYDLHIHSCLSPCSDEDMTPNNIVNMAVLKGLDIIAVSDHNSVDQVQTIMKLGLQAGLLVVPAMELCTAEEIHLLCLFPSLEAAERIARKVFEGIAVPENRPDIFGHQWILDEEDEPVREESRMLLAASGLDVETALAAVRGEGGVVIPAHVDRDAYSIIATLGAIPPEYGLQTVEASRGFYPLFAEQIEVLPGASREASSVYPLLAALPGGLSGQLQDPPNPSPPGLPTGVLPCVVNSDAHHLWDIAEPERGIELPERSVSALLTALAAGRGLEVGFRQRQD